MRTGSTKQQIQPPIRSHPHRSGHLYAFNFNGPILSFSRDYGATWQKINYKPADFPDEISGCITMNSLFGRSFLVSPIHPDTIFIDAYLSSCNPGGNVNGKGPSLLLLSTDAGKSWQFAIMKHPFGQFYYDPAFPDRAFALGCEELQRLTPNGWITISDARNLGCDSSINAVPGKENELIAIQNTRIGESRKTNILRSIDGGKTWAVAVRRFKDDLYVIRALSSEVWLASTHTGGVYGVTASTTWQAFNAGAGRSEPAGSIAFSEGVLYVASGDQYSGPDRSFLYSRKPNESNWKDLYFNLPHRTVGIGTIAINPRNSRHVIAELITGGNNSSLAVSTDGGRQWTIVKRFSGHGTTIVFDPVDPRVVYASAGRSIIKSTDRGFHFSKLPVPIQYFGTTRIVIDGENHQNVYFINGDIYRSIDGGRTVHKFDTGIRKNDYCACGANDLAVANPRNLFAITCDSHVYRFVEEQLRWQRISSVPASGNFSGCKNNNQRILSADHTGKHLFTITELGLFETTDGGFDWKLARRAVFDTTNPKLKPFFVATATGVYQDMSNMVD